MEHKILKFVIKLVLVLLADISMLIVFGFFIDFAIVCFKDLEMSDEVVESKLVIGCICIAICLTAYLIIVLWSMFEKDKEDKKDEESN